MAVELKKITQLAWRRHFLSAEGQEGMLFARERTPTIHKGLADEMIFEAGKVEGFKMALDILSEIVAAEPKRDQSPENV
jgi:hypothetical protein